MPYYPIHRTREAKLQSHLTSQNEMERATITVAQLAGLLGVSTWSIYESVKRGDCPVPPIRVGTRLVWSRHGVETLLGSTVAGRLTSEEVVADKD